MPITVGGTQITFNDSTTQSTAFSNAGVLNATAAASAGAVGTYAFLQRNSGTSISAGTTYAGSTLTVPPISVNGDPTGGAPGYLTLSGGTGSTPSGTWRAMQTSTNILAGVVGLFLRIS